MSSETRFGAEVTVVIVAEYRYTTQTLHGYRGTVPGRVRHNPKNRELRLQRLCYDS